MSNEYLYSFSFSASQSDYSLDPAVSYKFNKSKPQPYAPPGFEAESPGNNRQLRELISQLQDVLKRNKDHKDSPDFTPVQTKVLSN